VTHLQWIGKKAILNHHEEVEYKLRKCNHLLSVNYKESDNPLIQGDNLYTLKSLLHCEGSINYIFIDQPYNTINNKWIFNGNLKSSTIQKLLGKPYNVMTLIDTSAGFI
jgi:hypothetical protein